MKFSNKADVGTKESAERENDQKESKPFVRDDSDNSIFKKYQIDDIREIITEDCVGYYDADTLYYQAASNQDSKRLVITHKEEGWSEELSGIKVFKGLGKGIKEGSWLYGKNVDRELEGKDPYKLEDFETEEIRVLKGDEEYHFKQAQMQVMKKLKRVRNQFRIDKIIPVIGEGDNFRNELPLCRPYKGNRKDTTRPILLKRLRKWAVEETGAIETPRSEKHGVIECDDYVDMMGYLGFLHYRKTGKYNKIAILSDKDGYNAPKILCNPDTYNSDHPKKGKFKYPQAVQVPNTSECLGDIEMIAREKSTDYKFIGFSGLLWQMLTFDGADNYSALGHLNGGCGFGAESAYRLLKSCKTPKEALQATVDKFGVLLPYGVQYTDHTGKEHDIPTMEYMNTYFRVVYMLRSINDDMDFYKLCEAFKVDTSKIVSNNLLTPPQRFYEGSEEHTKEVEETLNNLLGNELKSYKSLKKGDLVGRMDKVKEILENISFDSHYVMKQFEKNLQD